MRLLFPVEKNQTSLQFNPWRLSQQSKTNNSFTMVVLIFIALNIRPFFKSPHKFKIDGNWSVLSVCRWRTSPWPSRMAVSSATLSTTTTPVSCQRRLSVMAPLRLSSAHRGAAWSSTAQPATLTTPLTLCQQAWMVLVSCVQLSVWMHFLEKKKNVLVDVYTSLTCHKDICSALECGIRGTWIDVWGI